MRNRHKTRNERKREARKTAIMAVALILGWCVVAAIMLDTWAEHPAEQTISYAEHMESIGGDPDAMS